MPTGRLSANKSKPPVFKMGTTNTDRSPKPPPRPTRPQQGPVRRPSESQATDRATNRVEKEQDDESFSRGLRGKNAGLRKHRQRSRLARVEDGMLGKPVDTHRRLPQAIGERWSDTDGQSIPDTTTTSVAFVTADYTTERNGYSVMYNTTDYTWTIPPGLSGVWRLTGEVRFAQHATTQRSVIVELNGTTNIYHFRGDPGAVQMSLPICTEYLFTEGDYFLLRVGQDSGGALALVKGPEYNQLSAMFVGVA